MSDPAVASLIAQLSGLPGVDDPRFPPAVGELVSSLPTARELLMRIIDDTSLDRDLRFKAFYGLLTHVRRLKDLDLYEELVDSRAGEFEAIPLTLLLRSQVYLQGPARPERLELALDYARRAADALPEHYGVLAHLATVIVTLEEVRPTQQRESLVDALGLVNGAIASFGPTYPTYFVTKARILALLEDYDAATEAIDRAIKVEPSESLNYAVRIGDHQMIKADIRFRAQLSRLSVEQERVTRVVDDVRGEFLGLLGLLAAVIAFVVTAATIASDTTFPDNVRLLVVMGGTTVVMFASYAALFQRHDRLQKLGVGIVGLALVAAGAFWP